MNLWSRITTLFKKTEPPVAGSTVRGIGTSKPLAVWPLEWLYQLHDIRTKIEEVKTLDQQDGQVKNLLSKLAGLATRGGIRFVSHKGENTRMTEIAEEWIKRVKLDKRTVRKQHARRLLAHGNLVNQNVVSKADRVEALIIMPTQTIRPVVDDKGQFPDPAKAYTQLDPMGMSVIAHFAKWQISWGDLDKEPESLYGRPILDAERKRARQMEMTCDDMVIRRRFRAPMRLVHVLEGADKPAMEEYKQFNKDSLENPVQVNSDLYTNKPGGVTAIQGDANLNQVKDVELLIQNFYSGAGTHAHHFGHLAATLNRDVYEDTLADLYELIEDIQETLCDCWEESLKLEFLLHGINADAYEWDLKLQGRKVETPNQAMDRALKALTLGVPLEYIVTEILNWNWERIAGFLEKQREWDDPYGARIDDELDDDGKPPLKIVEGNARGKESATYTRTK